MGMIVDANWTNHNGVTFQVCDTIGGTFADLYTEANSEVNLGNNINASTAYSLNTSQPYLAPWRYVKVRSGTTGGHQTQASTTVVTFVFQR